jgi:hypothetical protein
MQAKSASIIVQITKWIAILSMAVISLTLTTFSQGQATPTGFAVLHCDEIVGSKVRLRIILMNTMPEAETALERLKEGESFADVARLFSVDNATRANGGLIIGLMSVGDLRKEYQAALNGILPGGTTGIITLEAPVSQAASPATAKEAVQKAQQLLQILGYRTGPADGVMGSRTVLALQKFQSAHGLSVTGVLDGKTLDALNAMNSSAQKPDTPASAEEYEEVNPRMLDLAFEASLKRMQLDADGDIVALDYTITKFAVGGVDVILLTHRVEIDQADRKFGTISTLNFGTLRLTFDSSGAASLWLKPSQKKGLLSLRKSGGPPR